MNKVIPPLFVLMSLILTASPYAFAADLSMVQQGKEISFDRKKGNCLACHAIHEGEMTGELGPILIDMKSRYPEKSVLREQIWDASKRNPATSMPPFGRHRMLTEDEIDKVVEYIYSL